MVLLTIQRHIIHFLKGGAGGGRKEDGIMFSPHPFTWLITAS